MYSPVKVYLNDFISYLLGFILGVVILYLNFYITKFLRYLKKKDDNFSDPINILKDKNIFFAMIVLIAGVLFEELIFRSYILSYSQFLLNIPFSILLSTILFTLIHFRCRYLQIFIMGLSYSILTIYTNNLLTPIIAHLTNNCLIYIIKK